MGVGNNVLLTCKRKEARGKLKKLKKLQKAAFASRKKIEDVITKEFAYNKSKTKKKKVKKKKKKSSESEVCSSEALGGNKIKDTKIRNPRKRQVILALREDEAEIKRLSKKLGYNKRRSRNLPQVFAAEGLDYILEVCDYKKREQALSDSDNDTNLDIGKNEKFEVEKFSKDDGIDGRPGSSGESSRTSEQREATVEVELEEDIYGRLINRKTGSVISPSSNSYGKFKSLEESSRVVANEDRLKVERSVKSLLNRLNENTIVISLKTMKDLFSSHAHNDVKQLFYESVRSCVMVGYRLPDRILIEFGLLIALLHTSVSTDLSSHFVENLISDYLKSMKSPSDDKSLENVSVLIAELYNFKVCKDFIVVELVHRLVRLVMGKTLECAKLLIKYTATLFRKRNFDGLQKCISETQQFLSGLSDDAMKQKHLYYVTEEFMSIKNGNVRLWTDAVDFSLLEHYMSIYLGLTRKLDKQDELGMSVEDIENVKERGRWWLIGSAWMPSNEIVNLPQGNVQKQNKLNIDQSLLDLAKKAKMNTPLRRDVFCTLISSKNEIDAFEKLLRLSLKGHQEREIIHICMHCALQEVIYNPFYSAVIEQFCLFHKRFKLTTQYALWDRIKNLSTSKKWQRLHLATLTADLIRKRSISLTVLKVIEFGKIDGFATLYVRQVLKKVLSGNSISALREIFEGIVTSPAQKLFSQSLQIFIHVVLKESANDKLLERIDFLDSIWGDDRI